MSFIPNWISHHARVSPERIAIEDLTCGRTFGYLAFAERVARLAAHLADAQNVRDGDRVAVLARNTHHVLEIQYACAALGAIFVPFNWRLGASELVAAAQDCTPSIVLHESSLTVNAQAVATALTLPSLAWSSEQEPDAYEAALASAADRAPSFARSATDPWTIIYTSGTTGTAKGVVLSHGSALATMLSVTVGSRIGADSVTLTVLPFCHVAGLNLFTNPTLYMGGRVLLVREYDPRRVLALLTRQEHAVTHLCGVPANFQFMQALPEWSEKRFDGLRIMSGGAPVPDPLIRAWAERGASPQTVYGISEAGAAVLLVPDGQALDHLGTVGKPLMHVRIRVVDESRKPVADGTVGELQIRGPSVTPGYWGKPLLTSQTIDPEGWLSTGDAAVIGADGDVRLVDRFKDMYISGGENVYPAEVEAALYRHAAVAECAVIGVPDERWGEVGHAYVVLVAGQTLDPEALRTFARDHIAAFKIPRHVTQLAALPRNTVGKILKRELRQRPR